MTKEEIKERFHSESQTGAMNGLFDEIVEYTCTNKGVLALQEIKEFVRDSGVPEIINKVFFEVVDFTYENID